MGRPKSGYLSSYPQSLRDRIVLMRQLEEGWGPKTILAELKNLYGYVDNDLPNRSSIAFFLKQEGLIKNYERHSDLPVPPFGGAKEAHDLWQLDARGNEVAKTEKEELTIALLDIKDVFSKTYVCCFPAQMSSKRGHPNTNNYQIALRLGFIQHGMPKRVQVDHASVFCENTTKSPFPTTLHLWLVALGIDLCYSRVHQPTDQAHVERSHEVLYNQILKGEKTFKNWETLYAKCQERRNALNNYLPSVSCNELAPLQDNPNAKHSGRDYNPHKEMQLLDMSKVYQYLDKCTWYRKVANNNTISLGGQIYYLGLAKKRAQVKITFCSSCNYLLFQNDKELLIAQIPIKGLNKSKLIGQWDDIFNVPSLQLAIPFEWENKVSTTLLDSC